MARYTESEKQALNLIASIQSRPVYRPKPKLQKSLHKILKPLTQKFGVGLSELRSYWPEIVGERYANQTRPLSIQNHKGQKTLIIQTSSSSALFLQMKTHQIIERINLFIGPSQVHRLYFTQSEKHSSQNQKKQTQSQTYAPVKSLNELEKKQLAQSLKNITDETLKTPLEKLGQAIYLSDKE